MSVATSHTGKRGAQRRRTRRVACADHGSQVCEEPAPPPFRLSFGDAGLLCLHAILSFCIRMHRALFAPVPMVLAMTSEAARRSTCQHTTLVVWVACAAARIGTSRALSSVSEAPQSPY